MVTEDYVSFETAKLLKEKGFDEKCFNFYQDDTTNNEGIKFNNWYGSEYSNSEIGRRFAAPTLQMAMKWLRKEKNLCIEPYRTACGYLSTISKIPTGSELYAQEYEGDDEDSGQFTTYEKSCEAAIRYCLEKLI